MKETDTDQINRCPTCGQEYTDHPQNCSFCGWELFTPIMTLGETTIEEVDEDNQLLRTARQNFLYAVLVACWEQGNFDDSLFGTLTQGIPTGEFGDFIKGFKEKYEQDFFPKMDNKDKWIILSSIHAVAMGNQKDFFILDEGPDQITLAHVFRKDEEICAKYEAISWENVVSNAPQDPTRRNLALIGGYTLPDEQELEKRIRIGFNKVGASDQPSILLSSRLFSSKHCKLVSKAAKAAGCQVQSAPYLINGSSDFTSFLESWLGRAPLQNELALVAVSIDQDGWVKLQFHTIFQAGMFLESDSPMVAANIRSYNEGSDQLDLAIIRNSTTKGPVLYQTWRADLPYQQTATLTFTLKNRNRVEVAGLQLKPYSTKLDELLNYIPKRVSLKPIELDLALVIDTVASQSTLRHRCEVTREIIHKVAEEAEKGSSISYSVIAYGDRYPGGSNVPRGWPPPIRVQKKQTLDQVDELLVNLVPAIIEKCDFDSALDEGLVELCNLDWRSDALRWVVTVGQRPPHPIRGKHAVTQLPSKITSDWTILVKNLRETKKVNSMALVCPLDWPGFSLTNAKQVPEYAQSYAENFWKEFGYTERIDFETVHSAAIAKTIWNRKTAKGNGLCLPVLFSLGEYDGVDNLLQSKPVK